MAFINGTALNENIFLKPEKPRRLNLLFNTPYTPKSLKHLYSTYTWDQTKTVSAQASSEVGEA